MRRASKRRGEEGRALIEFALMLVLLFAALFFVFEMCFLIYTYSVIGDAAHEGVRHAIVRSGGDEDGTRARVLTFARLSMRDVSSMTTSVTFPDGDARPPNRVRVEVTYNYLPITAFGAFAPQIRSVAEGRMVVE